VIPEKIKDCWEIKQASARRWQTSFKKGETLKRGVRGTASWGGLVNGTKETMKKKGRSRTVAK